MNLLTICKTFATEDQALDYLINQRWPDGVKCLACDNGKVYHIATKGKTGKPCQLFACADCGLHFSATTGTLFHAWMFGTLLRELVTKKPLTYWTLTEVTF